MKLSQMKGVKQEQWGYKNYLILFWIKWILMSALTDICSCFMQKLTSFWCIFQKQDIEYEVILRLQ